MSADPIVKPGAATRSTSRRINVGLVLASVIPSIPNALPVAESAAAKAARLATEKKEKADKKAEAKRAKAEKDKRDKEEKQKKKDDEAKVASTSAPVASEAKVASEPAPVAAFAPLADADADKLTGEAKTSYFTHLAAHYKAASVNDRKMLELKSVELKLTSDKLKLTSDEMAEMLDDEGEEDEEDDGEGVHAPPSPKVGKANAKAKTNSYLKTPDPTSSGWETAPKGSGFEVTEGDDKPMSAREVRQLFAEEATKRALAATSPHKTSSFESQMLARLPPDIRRRFHLGQYVSAHSLHKALRGIDDVCATQRGTGLTVSLSGAFLAKQGKLRLLEDFATLRTTLLRMPGLYVVAQATSNDAAAYQLHTHFGSYTRMLEGLVDSTLHDVNPNLVALRAATWDHIMREQHDEMDFSKKDPLTGEFGVATPRTLFGVGGAGAILANAEIIEYATLRATSIHEIPKSPKKRKSVTSSDDGGGSSSESSAPSQGPAKRPKPAQAPSPKVPKAPQAPSAPAALQPVLPRTTQQPAAGSLPKLKLRAGAVDSNGAKIDPFVCKLFNDTRACSYRKCKFVHACLWCASAAHGIHEKSKCMKRFISANGGAPF